MAVARLTTTASARLAASHVTLSYPALLFVIQCYMMAYRSLVQAWLPGKRNHL